MVHALLILIAAATWEGPNSGSQGGSLVELPLVTGDGYEGVIFPRLPFNPAALEGDGVWTPATADVAGLERLLPTVLKKALPHPMEIMDMTCRSMGSRKACREFNRRRRKEISSIVKRLTDYRRQYAGMTVGDSRIVVVNFFLPSTGWHSTWRSDWVSVKGGGYGYWGIRFNVDTGKFSGFHVNSRR